MRSMIRPTRYIMKNLLSSKLCLLMEISAPNGGDILHSQTFISSEKDMKVPCPIMLDQDDQLRRTETGADKWKQTT